VRRFTPILRREYCRQYTNFCGIGVEVRHPRAITRLHPPLPLFNYSIQFIVEL
jgi:hypothetical protein